MIDTPPHIQLLAAIKTTLEAVDYQADAGVAGVKIRHRRNRYSWDSERPCVSIVFVHDVIPDDAALELNAWEKQRQLTVDLVVDLDLPPEDSDEDPTGNLALSLVAAASLRAMKDPASPIAQLSDYISGHDIEPSEDSKPDKGRLSLTSIVLYRVRSDDENVLLAEGVNG